MRHCAVVVHEMTSHLFRRLVDRTATGPSYLFQANGINARGISRIFLGIGVFIILRHYIFLSHS